MRKFLLKNNIGETVDLMTRKLFVYKPQGLGLSYAATYGVISDGFYSQKTRNPAQASVACDLVFTAADPYAQYQSLISWIMHSVDVKLGYQPREDGAIYYSPVHIDKIGKSERLLTGELSCASSFQLLAPWAEERPYMTTIAPTASPLVYPLVYPYTYGSIHASGETEPFTLNGHVEGAVDIRVAGPLENPIVALYKYVSGAWTLVGKMAYSGSISSGYALHLSTRPDSCGVYSVATSTGIETDKTSLLSMSNNNFFRIPIGVPCKLTLASDSAVSTIADVAVYDYYLTV